MAAQNYYNAQNWGRNIYGNTIGSVLNTTLRNPDYIGNPEAAFGMLSGFERLYRQHVWRLFWSERILWRLTMWASLGELIGAAHQQTTLDRTIQAITPVSSIKYRYIV